jgi:hypothetical protein
LLLSVAFLAAACGRTTHDDPLDSTLPTGDPECPELFVIEDNRSIAENDDLASLRCVREVDARLSIGGGDLDTLAGLERLEAVYELQIGGNLRLESLAGLASLRVVGWLTIANNDRLRDLTGLEALEQVACRLRVTDNPVLESLDGLGGLTVLGGAYGTRDGCGSWGRIDLIENPALRTLRALVGLREVSGSLSSCRNEGLTELGLSPELEITDRLVVLGSPLLPDSAALQLASTASPAAVKVDWNADSPGPFPHDPCPYRDDGICDEAYCFQGDVGAVCDEPPCCEYDPTGLCAEGTDSDADCPREPLPMPE